MKLRVNFGILVVSILLTLIGFNLIASSYANEMIEIGNEVGYDIIANVTNIDKLG